MIGYFCLNWISQYFRFLRVFSLASWFIKLTWKIRIFESILTLSCFPRGIVLSYGYSGLAMMRALSAGPCCFALTCSLLYLQSHYFCCAPNHQSEWSLYFLMGYSNNNHHHLIQRLLKYWSYHTWIGLSLFSLLIARKEIGEVNTAEIITTGSGCSSFS